MTLLCDLPSWSSYVAVKYSGQMWPCSQVEYSLQECFQLALAVLATHQSLSQAPDEALPWRGEERIWDFILRVAEAHRAEAC